MGYVHNTDITEFISPFAYAKTAGTWTPTIASNLISDVRTAAGAAFTLLIPVVLPGSSIALQGGKLVSIHVWYSIGTNAATAFAVALDKVSLNAQAAACTGAAIVHTLDTGHDTEAERYAVAAHKLTATLTTPAFIAYNTAIWLSFVVTAHAGTVWSNFGAQANFTLRL